VRERRVRARECGRGARDLRKHSLHDGVASAIARLRRDEEGRLKDANSIKSLRCKGILNHRLDEYVVH